MDKLNVSSREARRARTKSLVQLGAMVSKSGLLDTFDISLGLDLQRDEDLKYQVAALYKGLVELNSIANSDDVSLQLWAYQGLNLLGEAKRKNERKND